MTESTLTESGYTIRPLGPETWEAFAQFAEPHKAWASADAGAPPLDSPLVESRHHVEPGGRAGRADGGEDTEGEADNNGCQQPRPRGAGKVVCAGPLGVSGSTALPGKELRC